MEGVKEGNHISERSYEARKAHRGVDDNFKAFLVLPTNLWLILSII